MLISCCLQPKYIASLLKSAAMRKREQERRVERSVQREREKEGDKFADKESFVTAAYPFSFRILMCALHCVLCAL